MTMEEIGLTEALRQKTDLTIIDLLAPGASPDDPADEWCTDRNGTQGISTFSVDVAGRQCVGDSAGLANQADGQ